MEDISQNVGLLRVLLVESYNVGLTHKTTTMSVPSGGTQEVEQVW